MSALQEINRYMARLGDVSPRPPVEFRCGADAYAMIRLAYPRPAGDDDRLPAVPHLFGVPVRVDEQMPAGYWRAVDQYGHVISDGMIRQ